MKTQKKEQESISITPAEACKDFLKGLERQDNNEKILDEKFDEFLKSVDEAIRSEKATKAKQKLNEIAGPLSQEGMAYQAGFDDGKAEGFEDCYHRNIKSKEQDMLRLDALKEYLNLMPPVVQSSALACLYEGWNRQYKKGDINQCDNISKAIKAILLFVNNLEKTADMLPF